MANKKARNLNDTDIEGPGGTQATHEARTIETPEVAETTEPRSRRARVAHYMREVNVRDVRGDLEAEIREHPLRSLAVALGCGYLLAKILD